MNTTAPKLAEPIVETEAGFGITVSVEWQPQDGLDRLDAHAWCVGKDTPAHRKLAERLVAAIKDGAIITPGDPYTDVNGKRGVHSQSTILGRTMNADLRRLGY
jgi:hypothetical protein